MPRGTTKKSSKPEIEILPVPEGVVAVDDWCAVYGFKYNDKGEAITILDHWDIPEEDRILKSVDKTITIDFHKYFHIKESNFNKFYLQYKDSYVSKLNLITHYINYFIKFYDYDDELLGNYLRVKYWIDINPENDPRRRTDFINILYTSLITDTIYDKIKKMVEDNYRIDLAQTNKDNIKFSESLEFTNEHAKLLLMISIVIKILIPITLHYITQYKDKREIHNLSLYYKPIFDIIEDREHVNLYGKLFNSIHVKVNLSETKNKLIWEKYEMEQQDASSYAKELLDKNIIVDNIFKYLFIKNIIAFNSVIIETQLDFFVIKNLGINMREISTDKDSEGLSSLDKLEMNTTKIDESLIVLSKINISQTIKRIKKALRFKITKEEKEWYKNYLTITPIGRDLLFYYYAKYFNGYRDLKSITKRQYIQLMILMKKALEINGSIWIPQILSADIEGRINARTIHNTKMIEKVENSEAYQKMLNDKYAALKGLNKQNVIINLLSTLLNTQFTYCDYDMQDLNGKPIEPDFDQLCQEFIDFINLI
jgi:hypothetical protein